jgi:hypothetical protein
MVFPSSALACLAVPAAAKKAPPVLEAQGNPIS